jgi:hypothetical protein
MWERYPSWCMHHVTHMFHKNKPKKNIKDCICLMQMSYRRGFIDANTYATACEKIMAYGHAVDIHSLLDNGHITNATQRKVWRAIRTGSKKKRYVIPGDIMDKMPCIWDGMDPLIAAAMKRGLSTYIQSHVPESQSDRLIGWAAALGAV